MFIRDDRTQLRAMTALSASAGIAFWAVVSDEISQVIEFLPTRWQAERVLAEALRDEPDWRGILRVEKVELRTGDGELARRRPTASVPAISYGSAEGSS
jgi:hypothetical protein